MNALKKSSVLNRQCLRRKIDDLSPLLLQKFNLRGTNKDTLFRAVWNYYACGYPERLASNRRRIAQIAKIVEPAGGPNTQFLNNLNQPPTGVDLEDRMYHELVSCFHCSNESPAKEKSPPKRSTVKKELKLGNYSTLEQWNSWKLEKQQVLEMLKQYQDPYRTEELTRKLEKLNKLTTRRPLIVLPNICETHPMDAPTEALGKKIKVRRKSVEPLKQPDIASKPIGPYVNRKSKAAVNTAPETKSSKHGTKDTRSKATKKALKMVMEMKNSNRLFKVKEIDPQRADYDTISKWHGVDASGVGNSQQDIESLWEVINYKSKTAGKQSKGKKKKLKASNLRNKLSKMSYTSEIMVNKSANKAKNEREKDTNLEAARKQSIKSIQDQTFSSDKLQTVPNKISENNLGVRSNELMSKYDRIFDATQQVQPKSILSRKRQKGSVRKSNSWHPSRSSELFVPFKADKANKKKLAQTEYIATGFQESEAGTGLSPYQHGWPQPIGLQRPIESYFKSYLQFNKKEKSKEAIQTENPVQIDHKIHFDKLRLPIGSIETAKSSEIICPPDDLGNTLDETKTVKSYPLKGIASDAVSIKPDEARYLEISSASNSKTFPSDRVSNENIDGTPPLIMADIILECLKSYGSEISFIDINTSFMKGNKLDRFTQEIPIKKPQVKDEVKKIRAKKDKIKKGKITEDKINDEKLTMKFINMPSKGETAPCSLCNLVRKKQTDLRPYMKRMQKERERLELKTYYTQNILKKRCCPKQDALKSRRACAHQTLTNCYKALGLYHWVLELRRLQEANGCQP